VPDKDWKRWEREVATRLGGYRSGPRGSDVPDIAGLHSLAVECKLQTKLGFRDSHLQQAKRNANGEPWVLLYKEKHSGRKLAVMEPEFFYLLWDRYTRSEDLINRLEQSGGL
jgi:hypothetical protein